jgi:hypothetical protein
MGIPDEFNDLPPRLLSCTASRAAFMPESDYISLIHAQN